jgi:hypothetical protein
MLDSPVSSVPGKTTVPPPPTPKDFLETRTRLDRLRISSLSPGRTYVQVPALVDFLYCLCVNQMPLAQSTWLGPVGVR